MQTNTFEMIEVLTYLYGNPPLRRCYYVDIFYQFIRSWAHTYNLSHSREEMIRAALKLKHQFFTTILSSMELYYPDPLHPARVYFAGFGRLTTIEIQTLLQLDEPIHQKLAAGFYANDNVQPHPWIQVYQKPADTSSSNFESDFCKILTQLIGGQAAPVMTKSEIKDAVKKLSYEQVHEMRLNLQNSLKPVEPMEEEAPASPMTPEPAGAPVQVGDESQPLSATLPSLLGLSSAGSQDEAVSASGGSTSYSGDEFGIGQNFTTSTPHTSSQRGRSTRRRVPGRQRGQHESFEDFRKRLNSRHRI